MWGPTVHVSVCMDTGMWTKTFALFKYSSSNGGNYSRIMLMCVLFNVLLYYYTLFIGFIYGTVDTV